MKTGGERTNDVWYLTTKEETGEKNEENKIEEMERIEKDNKVKEIEKKNETSLLESQENLEDKNISVKLINTIVTSGQSEFVFVRDNYLYLADGFAGIKVFDISLPENPQLIGSYDIPGYSEGVFVLNNYAFVSDKGGGFLILEVSDPKKIVLVSRYKPIFSEGIFVVKDYLLSLILGGELKFLMFLISFLLFPYMRKIYPAKQKVCLFLKIIFF